LEEYIKNRDYTGALTLLEFNKRSDDLEEDKKQQVCDLNIASSFKLFGPLSDLDVDWVLCVSHWRLPQSVSFEALV
jgi:hypothetical protein